MEPDVVVHKGSSVGPTWSAQAAAAFQKQRWLTLRAEWHAQRGLVDLSGVTSVERFAAVADANPHGYVGT